MPITRSGICQLIRILLPEENRIGLFAKEMKTRNKVSVMPMWLNKDIGSVYPDNEGDAGNDVSVRQGLFF